MLVENRTGNTVWFGLYHLNDKLYTATTFPWGARQKLEPHQRRDFSPKFDRLQVVFWNQGAFGDMLHRPRSMRMTEVSIDKDTDGYFVYNHLGDPAPMDKVEHFVVLMLENRSFDNLLGWLYSDSGNVPPRNLPEPADGKPYYLGLKEKAYWNTVPASAHDTAKESDRVYVRKGAQNDRTPDPNPSEICGSFVEQMFGTATPKSGQQPDMWGFLANYKAHKKPPNANVIMECYTPDQVPVMSRLAEQFAVCDRWFGSVPCETWPNRSFLHAGTSFGRLNNCNQPGTEDCIPNVLPYAGKRTICDVLDELGIRWRAYQDAALVGTLLSGQFWTVPQKLKWQANSTLFLPEDLRLKLPPEYIFIEPSYGLDNNDQHPPHPVANGERLLGRIYQMLSTGPRWNRTVLIITHDEHGGCYDHVPPPAAMPPDGYAPQFPVGELNPFRVYGPRVPAIVISPLIEPGTVFRAPDQAWLRNDDDNGNRFPSQGGLVNFYVDTNELICPPGRVVTGMALRRKAPPGSDGNQVALKLQHSKPDGSDPQWLENTDWNGNYAPQRGGLGPFHADTNPLICPPGRVITGIAFHQKAPPGHDPATGDRIALKLRHSKPDGSDPQWMENPDWNGDYVPQQGGLGLFDADTNPLTWPPGALLGVALRQKGAGHLAPEALTVGAEFDHTSVLASLRDWVGARPDMLGPNERIRRAPTIWPVLTRTRPRADVPELPEPVAAPVGLNGDRPTARQIQMTAMGEAERIVMDEAVHANGQSPEWWALRIEQIAQETTAHLENSVEAGGLPPELTREA
ncbi:alkaline phosphatase family protein [Herbidospora mongoliensis]|uniref:alkaline phosphatase family protein n=1 Tax=Herbidospora mongoliensis TaxID=688067 RepID=UPI000832FA54|nr:alkaline phosphatase family protein [Herbidospora mongoliensis]